MESNLDRISFLGVDCLFSQQSQAKVKSPGPSEHCQSKWWQAYAVGIIGPSDSMHLPKLNGDESPLSPICSPGPGVKVNDSRSFDNEKIKI